MNFKQIEAFLMVAELQSFTKAARHLYMSQPAISFQIKSLEEDLQSVLFQRGDKKVTLTEAGRLLYPEARLLLRQYNKIKEGLEDLRDLRTGNIVVGAGTIPGEYILPFFIGGFHKKYPGIKTNLKIAGSGEVIRWLADKEIDLGITGAPVVDENICCQQWLPDKLVAIRGLDDTPCYCSDTEKIGLKEFLKMPLILREPDSGTRKSFEKSLSQLGLDLEQANIVMELGSTRSVITAVKAGLGVSVVSEYAVRETVELGRVRVISLADICLTRYLYILRHKEKTVGFAAEAFYNYLVEEDIYQGFPG